MNFKRLLTAAVVLAFLVLAGPAAADDLGGGTAAPATAPTADPAAVAPPAEAPAPAPVADPAQTPTTPEGEEQPPDELPDGEQPPSDEGDNGNVPSGETGGESTGTLPRTGLELLALTMIGLGLLLAGGALWPTSSWPPPRDRLIRSPTRR
jgi:hypothetical protein